MVNASEKWLITPPEEVPKSPKPERRYPPPEGLRVPGRPRPPKENVIAMPVPENTPMGAEAVPVHLKIQQETVDIGAVIKQGEEEATKKWEAQRKKEEEYQDQLSQAIAAFEPYANQPEGMDIPRKLKPDKMPPKPRNGEIDINRGVERAA